MYYLNMSKEEFFESLRELIENATFCQEEISEGNEYYEDTNYYSIKSMEKIIKKFGLEDICGVYTDGTGIYQKEGE